MYCFYHHLQEFKRLKFKPAVRLTLFTTCVTALLAGIKIIAGKLGQSHALFADGIHSIADVLINIMVMFAAHFGGRSADKNHPYGHGRIETAGTFLLALILLLASAQIIFSAGEHLWGHQPAPEPKMYVLWVALLAIILNEWVFRYTLRLAKQLKSSLLEANAWHSRSDAAVSVVVFFGITGALFGLTYLDAIGAVFVGLLIAKMGIGLAWKSISELVDTGVDENMIQDIKQVINNIEGVNALHLLRTRTINNRIFIDVHVIVSPRISVSEGHFISDQVIKALYQQCDIQDVTVHVDPEDDEITHPSSQLPSRKDIIFEINSRCDEKKLNHPKEIRLHYLNGAIEVEMIVANHSNSYQDLLKDLTYLSKITVYIGHA